MQKRSYWENLAISFSIAIFGLILLPLCVIFAFISAAVTPAVFEYQEYVVHTNDPINARLVVSKTDPLEGDLVVVVPWGSTFAAVEKIPNTDCGFTVVYIYEFQMHSYEEYECLRIEIGNIPITKITDVSYMFGR